MNAASTPKRPARTIIAAGLIVLGLAVTGVAAYGFIRSTAAPPTSAEPAPSGTPALPGGSTGHGDSAGLPKFTTTGDPEEFAVSVAHGLMSWDTSDGHLPIAYMEAVLTVAAEEKDGLFSDLAGYYPTQDAWLDLRQYETRQHLTIDRVFVPEAWEKATEQARAGQLAPGTVAYTVEGTRHRAGVWHEEPTESAHPVAFTMFLVCEPSYDACRLLRLSRINDPLN
ncbi:MAG: hypothetical protein ACK5LO_07700 [Leucobacter sp.]